jgi:hypothetical protein
MVDDATTSSNPSIALVQNEELEEALLDVNVSQWLFKEEPIGKVVCIQVTQSIWDCQVSPNLCALTIYLELVFTSRNRAGKFNECQCEDDDVRIFFVDLGLWRWILPLAEGAD